MSEQHTTAEVRAWYAEDPSRLPEGIKTGFIGASRGRLPEGAVAAYLVAHPGVEVQRGGGGSKSAPVETKTTSGGELRYVVPVAGVDKNGRSTTKRLVKSPAEVRALAGQTRGRIGPKTIAKAAAAAAKA